MTKSLDSGLKRWFTFSKPTKALLLWLLALLVVGLVLFLWATCKQGAAVAFDVLTQHKSPIGQDLGVAGMLVSCFGYFVVPAGIGALVGAMYLSSTKVSAKSVADQKAAIAEQMQPPANGAG